MFLPVLSSLLGIIAFLPLNCYPASFVFLIPLFIFFLKETKLWRLVAGAFIFKIIFALGAAYFTLEPIAWASELLIIFFLPFNIWLIKKLSNRIFRSRPTAFFNKELILLALLPFLFTLSDILQARFSLLPSYIMAAGDSLGSSPFLGLAGLGGITFLTFFAALINALAAGIIFNIYANYCHSGLPPRLARSSGEAGPPRLGEAGDPESRPSLTKKILDSCPSYIRICDFRGNDRFNIILLTTVILLLLFGWLVSVWRINKNAAEYNSKTNIIKIAVLSAKESLYPTQFEEIKKELAKHQLDLLVLPENIFYDPNNPSYFSDENAAFMQSLAQDLNVNVLAVFDAYQSSAKYLSAVLFNTQGEILDVHNKNRITFAGEYWPFGSWQPPLSDALKKASPEIKNFAVFDPKNAYTRGQRNNLSIDLQGKKILFAAPICLEIQYPNDLKNYQAGGARFIINPSSNRWVGAGLNHFLYLTGNLKKIEAVWLGLPIISSGVKDYAGLTLPGGQTLFENPLKSELSYTLFFGEIKY